MNRSYSLLTLIFVVGLGVGFGVFVGGRIQAPDVALAAPVRAADLGRAGSLEDGDPTRPTAPAMSSAGRLDFADVAETALAAVVSITNTQVREGVRNPHGDLPPENLLEEFFERFRERQPAPDESPQGEGEPRERRENSAGSGFLISSDGYLMSNHHVVEGASRLVVTLQNGTQYDARVVGKDPAIDFALLKIDPDGRELPYLPLGDSNGLRIGEWVLAIGNPLEFSHSVTVGVVSAKDRTVPLRGTDLAVAQFIQTDAAINLGNSGGPLVNAAGEVVGINTAINRERLAEGIGFALPIRDAIRSRDEILDFGEVRRGILGVTMNPDGIDVDAMRYYGLPDRNGVIVAEVRAGGPAEDAGVRREDIIRSVDGTTIRGNGDLIAAIASRRPGDEVSLDIIRDGNRFEAKAVLAERVVGEGGRILVGGEDAPDEQTEEAPAAVTGLGLTVETYSQQALQDLIPHGMPLGNLEPGLEGALITYVDLASVAEDKGLVMGFVITSIDGHPIRDADDWKARIAEVDPGSVVKLHVRSPRQDGFSQFVYLPVPEGRD
jgi:serine protease Do